MLVFEAGQRIHFIGIGGFGISAIARILLEKGCVVSGSDRSQNALTEALQRDGATIFHGHAAENVGQVDGVIYSSAIAADHVELLAAQSRGIPVYKRREMLSALMQGKKVIAVSGTHGKTTTTSMIVHILRETGVDPSYIVGGVMASTGTNAGVGSGDVFVIEADEYDYMFLGLKPDIAVVTSIEYDHPDFFRSWVDLRDAFYQFVELLPEDGVLIGCGDDATTEMLIKEQTLRVYQNLAANKPARSIVSYGVEFLDFVDVLGWHVRSDVDGFTLFDLEIEGKLFGPLAQVRLSLPGKHNVQNALAAIIACNQLRVTIADAVSALESFRSTGRRFELRGTAQGVSIIDDYAHHPTAVRFTLEAARARYPDHEIWAVWQPHMYSRTQHLLDDYAGAFVMANHVIVTEIYAAREAPIPGVTGQTTADAIQHPDVIHLADFNQIAELLLQRAKSPAVVVIMSAGDAPQIGQRYLEIAGESYADGSPTE